MREKWWLWWKGSATIKSGERKSNSIIVSSCNLLINNPKPNRCDVCSALLFIFIWVREDGKSFHVHVCGISYNIFPFSSRHHCGVLKLYEAIHGDIIVTCFQFSTSLMASNFIIDLLDDFLSVFLEFPKARPFLMPGDNWENYKNHSGDDSQFNGFSSTAFHFICSLMLLSLFFLVQLRHQKCKLNGWWRKAIMLKIYV